MAKDAAPANDKRKAAEERVRAWTEQGELQLPRFAPDRISALRDSVSYPPKGSSLRRVSHPAAPVACAAEAATAGMQASHRWWGRN